MLNREVGVESGSGSGCRIGEWVLNRGVGAEGGSGC